MSVLDIFILVVGMIVSQAISVVVDYYFPMHLDRAITFGPQPEQLGQK